MNDCGGGDDDDGCEGDEDGGCGGSKDGGCKGVRDGWLWEGWWVVKMIVNGCFWKVADGLMEMNR